MAMTEPRRRPQAFLARLAQQPRERAAVEIARNLGFVLNTRKACGSVVADFGLGDYECEVNTHHAVAILCTEMLAAVRRNEPRLTGPAVRLLGRRRYNLVRFEIAGRLDGHDCLFDVDIDTTTRWIEVQVVETLER